MEIKTILSTNKKEKPDQDNLMFGKYYTDHMFVMDWSEEKGWHNATIQPYAPFIMDPATMILHYGQGVFEGMKAYKSEKGEVVLFRPDKNFQRLNVSDERLCIPHIDEEFAIKALTELIRIDADWVPEGANKSLYIRPFTFASEVSLGVHPANAYKFAIIMTPVNAFYKGGLAPVKILIEEEYARAVKGGIGFTKAIANYATSLKGQEKAQSQGYSQVLWLDAVEKKYIEEVGTMNVFFKVDGKLITPELSGSILAGVTRDSVLTLLRDWGYDVEERKFSLEELLDAYKNGKLEEVFGTGTAVGISPVGTLGYKGEEMIINNGEIGEVSARLFNELEGIKTGKIEDRFNWLVKVC